jgi:hypothetical protein
MTDAMNVAPTISERPNHVRKLTWLATACLVAFVGTLLLVEAAWSIVGPVIPPDTLKSLRGAMKDDVRRILGEPSEIQRDGDWTFVRPPRQGWVTISFDENGRVHLINDEQACPGLFDNGSSWSQ